MVTNDNGDDIGPRPPPRLRTPDPLGGQYDEVSLSGGACSVALGLAALDAAYSLSLSMQNAVVEQQNGWAMQRLIMTKAMERLLCSSIGDRAADLILNGKTPPPASSGS